MNAWDFSPYFPGISITAVAETGTSWLLFTTDQVMKILKPSKRAARDLSTPEARRIILEEELELLKRFAPGVGERLQPLKNQEQVLDMALVMRRLPRGANLLGRLLTKRVTPTDLQRVGSTIAKIHAKSPAPVADVAAASVEQLRLLVDQAAQPLLDPGASMFLSHDISVRVRDKLLGILHAQQATFLQRQKKRGVRLIHGALHAENVYVEDGSVSFLDAARGTNGSVVGDGLVDLAAVTKDVRLYVPPEECAKLVSSYFQAKSIAPEMEQLLQFYELLWTMRQFTQHTAALTEGTGGPLDTEMVQRYRSRLMRAVATQFAPTALQVHEKRNEEAREKEAQQTRQGVRRQHRPHSGKKSAVPRGGSTEVKKSQQPPRPKQQQHATRSTATRAGKARHPVTSHPARVTKQPPAPVAQRVTRRMTPRSASRKPKRPATVRQPKRSNSPRMKQHPLRPQKQRIVNRRKSALTAKRTGRSAAGAKKPAVRTGKKRSVTTIGQKLRSFLGLGRRLKHRS